MSHLIGTTSIGSSPPNSMMQRCDSCLMASHNLSHLKIFKMSQGSLNCHSFFGAFCMFKSHQLCFYHICETQYLSVITMNSIILQFVKKGTTTWCSITQQNTNSLLGSADYNTCMIQYMYDEYWKRVKMLHCPHASGWWMNISFTRSWFHQLLSSILL